MGPPPEARRRVRFPEHAPHLPVAAEHREVELVASRRGVELNEYPQTGRVDELQATEVQHECPGTVEHIRELLLEPLLACEVELARKPNNRRIEVPLGTQRAVLRKGDGGIVEHRFALRLDANSCADRLTEQLEAACAAFRSVLTS